jgi:hypothetical protein
MGTFFFGACTLAYGGANFRVASELFSPRYLFVPLICDLGILHLRRRVVSGCRGKRKRNEFRRHQRPEKRFITLHRYALTMPASIHNLNRTPFYSCSLGHNIDNLKNRRVRKVGFFQCEPESNNDFECTRPLVLYCTVRKRVPIGYVGLI